MNLEAFLRRAILTLLFVVPFIPLIIAPGFFFPFITGKNFAFRIIVELLFGLWILQLLISSGIQLKRSFILYAFAGFVAIIGIADVFGAAPFKSIWSNYERMEGWVTLVHLFVYFLVLASVLNTEKLWYRFFNTSIGISVVLVGYAFLQKAGLFSISQSTVRVDATLGNSTYLAAYLLFHIFLTLFLWMRHRGTSFVRYAYIVVIVGQLLALYFTATRGAILGLLGGLVVSALFIVFFGERKNIKRVALGGLVGIVALVGVFLTMRDTAFVQKSPVLSRFASISLEETTTKSRFIIWRMAWEGFKEKPVLGWGQENFNYVFNKYYDPRMYNQEQWFDRTHNVVLDWLIAGGILGLLAYLSLFGLALYYLLFGRGVHQESGEGSFTKEERALLLGLFAAYFFQNLFVFDNITSYVLFATFLAYLHYLYGRPWSSVSLIPLSQVSSGSRPAFLVGVAVLTLLVTYLVNVSALRTNNLLIKAVSSQSEGPTKNLEYFKKIFEIGGLGVSEAREQLLQAAFSVITQTNGINDPKIQEIRQQFIALADGQLKSQVAAVPEDARYRLFYGSFLNQSGNYQESFNQLKEALRLSPRKQTMYFELGANALNRNEPEEAFNYFKRAYELEPSFEDARRFYALGAVYARHNDVVQELTKGIPIADERFVRAYISVGQFRRAVEVAEILASSNPNNRQAQLMLAVAYYSNGEVSRGVALIRSLIEKDPQFKTQGEAYIQQMLSGRPL